MLKKIRLAEEVKSYVFIVVGCALFAVGDVMFVNPYLLAPGGTYGLANVFNTLWPWKISYYAICMDIPLLIVGTLVLGPRFGVKTVVSTILIFIFTWLMETFWGYDPVIHGGMMEQPAGINCVQIPHSTRWFVPDYILNTLVGGIIYGVAIGLIFKSGATSGGSDIISMILHKYLHMSLGTFTLIVDSCITLTTLLAFHQIRLPIYSILLIAVESKVIDMVVDGIKTYKTVFIVTDKMDEVRNFILHEVKRGGTVFDSTGLYNGAERNMIYVTLGRADLVKLKANLRLLDPGAFVNIIDSSEIMGRGFKSLPDVGH